MEKETKKNYLAYRTDYSVCVLRYENRRLGRWLKEIEGADDEEQKAEIRKRISQIEDTLKMLKEKLIV